jgi:hypothetical protein
MLQSISCVKETLLLLYQKKSRFRYVCGIYLKFLLVSLVLISAPFLSLLLSSPIRFVCRGETNWPVLAMQEGRLAVWPYIFEQRTLQLGKASPRSIRSSDSAFGHAIMFAVQCTNPSSTCRCAPPRVSPCRPPAPACRAQGSWIEVASYSSM